METRLAGKGVVPLPEELSSVKAAERHGNDGPSVLRVSIHMARLSSVKAAERHGNTIFLGIFHLLSSGLVVIGEGC